MASKKILYCGDSEAGGPANYLLACLRYGRFQVTHVPPGKKLTPAILKRSFDAIIFSDYGSDRVSNALQRRIAEQVNAGCGFLMVGGWGSFAGPFGRWKNSVIESVLPVRCLASDDRRNYASGLGILRKNGHESIFRGLDFGSDAPVIIGLNELKSAPNGRVLLSARKVRAKGNRLALEGKEYPLLVVSKPGERRTAAFATDFAPHWCGGLVDWGNRRLKLPVNSSIKVEIGDSYARFIVNLVSWLAGRS